jgi:hypothetical protein
VFGTIMIRVKPSTCFTVGRFAVKSAIPGFFDRKSYLISDNRP